MPASRIPSSTYRLQLNRDFRFPNATRIVDYLHSLGISDIYVSPILGARAGSTHGYDVTDPTRVNAELGSEEEFDAFQKEVQERGMGLVIDIVPNHMAASTDNPWWMDVLENGPQSAYAAFFDIDWHPPAPSLDGKILLPVLGRPFGEALDAGELKVVFQDGRIYVQYFESMFPLAPRSYYEILSQRVEQLKASLGEENPVFHEYAGVLASLQELARGDRRGGENAADRRLRFEATHDRLWALMRSNQEIADFLNENLRILNGTENDPASMAALQRLLSDQHYKLAYWQNINEGINYRRFFTIADLVGVRVEDPVVFEATHGNLFRLISRVPLTGLRIDHIDGLRDPYSYLTRLQERLNPRDTGVPSSETYLLVEKILERGEWLPEDWPVSGTTGYDYLNQTNCLAVYPPGARRLEQIYCEFIKRQQKFSDVLYQKKKLVMNTLLGVEMRSLGRQLGELAIQDRYARELSRGQLYEVLIEVTASFCIYRTYIRNLDIPEHATKYITRALDDARERAPQINTACFDFVREILLLENPAHVLPGQRESRLAFVTRWQQFTGPILAKGMEDTALYVYHPLLSLNEVGGDPAPPSVSSREDVFSFLAKRQEHWPNSLNATTTHDTKRSEGVRARINVLSELAEEWQKNLHSWAQLNERHKQVVDGRPVPDRNEEYFLYQTLLGVWPLEHELCESLVQRLQEYLVKATREAMVHTRWTRPNQKHEEALQQFVARILSSDAQDFLGQFRPLQRKVAFLGMVNGLAQTLLKITLPGVPDFYQGSELWDFRLVDPDNRRPVNFDERIGMLSQFPPSPGEPSEDWARDLYEHWVDGRIKLYLIQRALTYRRENLPLFQEGGMVAVNASGKYADNVIAYLRQHNSQQVLTLIPRWLSQVSGQDSAEICWSDTSLLLPAGSPDRWRNLFTGEIVIGREGLTLCAVLKNFPVALLAPY